MLWNVLGTVLPLPVALICVPIMIARMGDARFGVVSIAWVLIGYLGVLDLGLGRALTREIASMRGHGESDRNQGALARRATTLMLGVGCAWTLAIVGVALGPGADWLSLEPGLHAEARRSFLIVALGPPALLYTNAKLAWLEGMERYDLANAIRVPIASSTVLGPTLASLVTPRLDLALAAMVCARALAAFLLALRLPYGADRGDDAVQTSVRALWTFGRWLTVTNVVGPILVHSDRLYIGAVLSAAAVTYYVVPYDIVVRLTSFPAAALSVLFPHMTRLRAESPKALEDVVAHAGRWMLWGWSLGMLVVLLVGRATLNAWVGPTFLGESLQVWRWLAVGVYLNGMAFIPYNLVQSAGRSDVTAKLHLVELPLFGVALVVFVKHFGIVGAAYAWSLRVGIDAAFLYAAAWQMHPTLRRTLGRVILPTLACASVMLVANLFGGGNGLGR
jgi:O-antigen/teichoic acid export membrane protein